MLGVLGFRICRLRLGGWFVPGLGLEFGALQVAGLAQKTLNR